MNFSLFSLRDVSPQENQETQEKDFHLIVFLPDNRYQAGILQLHKKNDSHSQNNPLPLMEAPCLGRSDQARARKAGNPARDPTRPFGDTPLGSWKAARIVYNRPKRWPLGVVWIGPPHGANVTSGQALVAAKQGRTGLAIHSGRGNERLVPTYGCLRILDEDFLYMIQYLDNVEFDITIKGK